MKSATNHTARPVKQIIMMHEAGVCKKEIARRLSISKNTVKGYIQKINAQDLSLPEIFSQDTPELE